jgi:hypothetical protein
MTEVVPFPNLLQIVFQRHRNVAPFPNQPASGYGNRSSGLGGDRRNFSFFVLVTLFIIGGMA